MIKLLVITRENEPDKAYGLGRTLRPFIKGMQERGHNTVYFSKTECQASHDRWFLRFLRLLKPFFSDSSPALAERLVQGIAGGRHARRIAATHVWIHDPWLAFGFMLGMWSVFHSRKKIKIYITEHGLGSFTWAASQDGLNLSPWQFRLMLYLERKMLAMADRVWVPSEVAMRALLRDLAYSRQPEHFSVLLYGRPERLSEEVIEPDYSIFGFTEKPAVPIVLAVGRISPAKNYKLLIDAVCRLDTHFANGVQLLIAGGGDAASLQEYANTKGLKNPLRTAFVDEMDKVYSMADVYVSSCDIESFGQANREALSYGLVCIVPSAGGSGEVLGSGAWLVPAQADVIASAVCTVLKNIDIALFWKKQALLETQKFPTWQEIIDLFEQQLLHD